MNERYLKWGEEANTEMSRRILSQRLGLPMEEVDRRLYELGLLVPDMECRWPSGFEDRVLACDLGLPPKHMTARLCTMKDNMLGKKGEGSLTRITRSKGTGEGNMFQSLLAPDKGDLTRIARFKGKGKGNMFQRLLAPDKASGRRACIKEGMQDPMYDGTQSRM
eukprot:100937-Pelagomonas_calceolata.AAC.4